MDDFNRQQFITYISNDNNLLDSYTLSGGKDETLIQLFTDVKGNVEDHTIRVLKDYNLNNTSPDEKVQMAIIFHDLGKAYTHTQDENGTDHYYGHQAKSEELFKFVAESLSLTKEDAVYIQSLIRWHDDEVGKKLLRQMYQDNGKEFFDSFIALKRSDINDHEEPRKTRRFNEISEYIPRMEKMVTEIENELNQNRQIDRLYAAEDVIKDLNLQGSEISQVLSMLDSVVTPENAENDVNAFITRYKEAKASKMRNITGYKKTREEEKGVTEKHWIEAEGRDALFKITQYRNNGTHPNAHYAELFVSEFAKSLDVPASDIELAFDAGNIGCISYSFLKDGDKMTDFNEILSQIRPDFNSKKLLANNTNESYSVPLILEGLEYMSKNKQEYDSLRKQFFEYCLMYSMIEHYDINPSNLAVIRNGNDIRLAPMFDNGTSLDVSIPLDAVKENLSDEWISEIRPKNLSKIGIDKRYCQYDELETYILSKYYDDVASFLAKLGKTDENTRAILAKKSYNGLAPEYKDIINRLMDKNSRNLSDRAQLYKNKADIEKIFVNITEDNIKNGMNGVIPETAAMDGLLQRNRYHDKSVSKYCAQVIQTIQSADISDEKKKLMQWAVLFNEMGKVKAHEVVIKDGIENDTFKNYSTLSLENADKKMSELGFSQDDKVLITALIKSHVYRDNEPGTIKGILNLVGEKNLDVYMVMKQCEDMCKNPAIKVQLDNQRAEFKKAMEEEIKNNNRELIKALPIKSKSFIAMGLKGKQIGLTQNELAEYIRKSPQIYAYYKARGHLDRYKKDLIEHAKQYAKEIKNINKNHNATLKAETKNQEVMKGAKMDTQNKTQEEIIMDVMKKHRSKFTQGVPLSDKALKNLYENMIKKMPEQKMLENHDVITNEMENAIKKLPKYQYRGVFIHQPTLTKVLAQEGIVLPEPEDGYKLTKDPHITTSIKGGNVCNHTDIGSQVKIAITGYASVPGRGLALKAELMSADSDRVKAEFNNTKEQQVMHITVYTAPDVKPKESAGFFNDPNAVNIKFDKPIELPASYGGFTQEGKVDVLSPSEKAFKELANDMFKDNDRPYAKGLLAANAKDIGDKTVYLKSIIDQRSEGPQNAGSSIDNIPNQNDSYDKYSGVLEAMASAKCRETTKEEIERGGIRQGQRSFELEIPGKQGVMSAKDLPDNAKVYAVDGHGVGSIEFCTGGVEKQETKTTTLISFTNEENECTFVVTALPGEVRAPSNLQDKGISEGQTFTKDDVIKLAGENAVIKYVPEDRIQELENMHNPIKQIYNEQKEIIDKAKQDEARWKSSITVLPAEQGDAQIEQRMDDIYKALMEHAGNSPFSNELDYQTEKFVKDYAVAKEVAPAYESFDNLSGVMKNYPLDSCEIHSKELKYAAREYFEERGIVSQDQFDSVMSDKDLIFLINNAQDLSREFEENGSRAANAMFEERYAEYQIQENPQMFLDELKEYQALNEQNTNNPISMDYEDKNRMIGLKAKITENIQHMSPEKIKDIIPDTEQKKDVYVQILTELKESERPQNVHKKDVLAK